MDTKDLIRICDIPEFIIPWIDRFYEATEIDLLLLLANNAMSAIEINRVFSPEPAPEETKGIESLTRRAYRRGVINLRNDGCFEPANFHARFDKWAMFEGWKDTPRDIRTRLCDWELADYHHKHADQIEGLQKGQQPDSSLIYPEYILMHEAETLLDRATRIYLMPCNCRSMLRACSQTTFTCIRFENDRDLGWEISASKAKEIVRSANKSGLMQSGEVGLTEEGQISGAICNCCADCCFPHKLAEKANARKLWPLSRYVARHLADKCISCGLCAKRCPFQAFVVEKMQNKSDSRLHPIRFDPDLCRGCGICCTACPKEAIEMVPLENKASSINQILREINSNC